MKPFTLFSSTAALTATALGIFSTAAVAAPGSMTPETEVEIDVGLGCLVESECLTQEQLAQFGIASITSLVDATTGTRSRLFVDNLSTLSTYFNADAEFNNDVELLKKDAGTNFTNFWYRPSTDEEKGQLEVGTFEIDFVSTVKQLAVDFFDTERNNATGAIALNGEDLAEPDYVAKGKDGNIATQIFADVSSITLKLGFDTASGTGDGVNFRLADASENIPEPSAIVGLALLAAGGAFGRRRREASSAE